jgi:hypothetical protein
MTSPALGPDSLFMACPPIAHRRDAEDEEKSTFGKDLRDYQKRLFLSPEIPVILLNFGSLCVLSASAVNGYISFVPFEAPGIAHTAQPAPAEDSVVPVPPVCDFDFS